jgi:bis(5'-nucleosidyl)-tetraphosphatase
MKDYSFGIIPLQQREHTWWVCLVQHHAGHWAFPKGHPEQGESPKESAERELFEETGLRIQRFLSEESIQENYSFTFKGQLIYKTVEYFLALVEGNLLAQEEEIAQLEWVPLDMVEKKVTFSESRLLCKQVMKRLS